MVCRKMHIAVALAAFTFLAVTIVTTADAQQASQKVASRVLLRNVEATSLIDIMGIGPTTTSFAAAEHCATQAVFDLRDQQWNVAEGVSVLPPVSNQGKSCQSCWIHAALSAIETSVRYLKHEAFEPLSKQEVLDCARGHAGAVGAWEASYDCDGGSHELPFSYAQISGVLRARSYPLKGAKGKDLGATAHNPECPTEINDPVLATDRQRISTWDFVRPKGNADTNFVPEVAATADIKRELCLHRGVVSWVDARGWNAPQYWTTNGKLGQKFIIGSRTPTTQSRLKEYAHIVQIVGWQDNLALKDVKGTPVVGFWIIKNSWGSNWADAGYALVPFDHQFIGLSAAWVHGETPTLTPEKMTQFLNLQAKLPIVPTLQ